MEASGVERRFKEMERRRKGRQSTDRLAFYQFGLPAQASLPPPPNPVLTLLTTLPSRSSFIFLSSGKPSHSYSTAVTSSPLLTLAYIHPFLSIENALTTSYPLLLDLKALTCDTFQHRPPRLDLISWPITY